MEERFHRRLFRTGINTACEQVIFDLLIAKIVMVEQRQQRQQRQQRLEAASDDIVFGERLYTTAADFDEERFIVNFG